jgi:hypothetical protein
VQSSTAGGIAEIDKISQVIHEVSDIVASIAAAIEEQSTVTKDIARNIAEASTGVRDANKRVSETSQATAEIAREIAGVDQAAGQMADGSEQVQASATELSKWPNNCRPPCSGSRSERGGRGASFRAFTGRAAARSRFWTPALFSRKGKGSDGSDGSERDHASSGGGRHGGVPAHRLRCADRVPGVEVVGRPPTAGWRWRAWPRCSPIW